MGTRKVQSASVWRFIVLLFSAIIGSAAVAFPEYRQALVYGLVALLVGAVILWQFLRIGELQAENKEQVPAPLPPPTDSRMWDEVETIDLFLEEGMWKPTNRHRFHESATLRVTATGPKRFVVHLATDIVDSGPRKPKYASVERTAETKSLRRTFTIPKEGEYALVVEPSGASGFWVKVHVEVEYVPGVVGFDW